MPTTTNNNDDDDDDLNLTSRYMKRLNIDNNKLLLKPPTIENLRYLQERHLATIPFENLVQHGCCNDDGSSSQLQVLDVVQTAHKILDNGYGGFCFELNILFGTWLRQLGYEVNFVPSYVVHGPVVRSLEDAAGTNNAEGDTTATDAVPPPPKPRRIPEHAILIVTCEEGDNNDTNPTKRTYYVDVGFGEPPLHPLVYDVVSGNSGNGLEQITPEGMRSKIVRDDDDIVTLYWYKNEQQWMPRIQWSYSDSIVHNDGNDDNRLSQLVDDKFQPGLEQVQQPTSIFSQKLIACLLTRNQKITLAGNKLKITGPPRFSTTPQQQNDDEATVEEQPLVVLPIIEETVMEDTDSVRDVLQQYFNISLTQTNGLDLSKSLAADPSIWSHQ